MNKKRWITGVLAGVVISTTLVGCGNQATKSQQAAKVLTIDYDGLANPAHPNWSQKELAKQEASFTKTLQSSSAKYEKLENNGKVKPRINNDKQLALDAVELAYVQLGAVGGATPTQLKEIHDKLINPGKSAGDVQPDKTHYSHQFSKAAIDYAFTHISQQSKDLYAVMKQKAAERDAQLKKIIQDSKKASQNSAHQDSDKK